MSSATPGDAPSVSSLFFGLPDDVLESVLSSLERQRYPAGEVVIAEGDKTNRITVVEHGWADVSVADRRGLEHRVASVGPGSTVGEMSLFTGQPASGTVRAATDLDVLVMREAQFEALAAAHPVVYRNLGVILADRLARTNRLAARDVSEHLGVLVARGGPAEIAWALAASVAWHTRSSTLLVVVGEAGSEELERLAAERGAPREPRAHLLSVASLDEVREHTQAGSVAELSPTYSRILVLADDRPAGDVGATRVLELTPPGERASDGATALRGWTPRIPGAPRMREGAVDVPPLDDRDVASLRGGLLPLATPAGRALGSVARDLAGLRVGLALGAGSVKGYAHFGALHALERLGIPTDAVAGTSVGSLAACLHAMETPIPKAIDVFDRSGPFIFRPTISPRGLLNSRPLARYFREEIGGARFEDQPIPLAVVAADLATNREVVFRRGLLWLALLGSMSIPGIFPAVRVGPYTVVDGGVLNPVPSSVVAGMGADVIIAVRLSAGIPPPETEAEAVATPGQPPNSLGVLLRSFDIMYSRLTSDLSGTTMVSVTPDLPELQGAGLRNWSRGGGYVPAGADAVHEALPRLRAALPWLAP